MAEKVEKKRLGELLYTTGIISKDQLDWAIKEQSHSNKRLGEILIEANIVSRQDILGALEFQLGIPQMDLKKYTIDYNIASKVPERIARRYGVIAVGIDGEKLKVAMKDPLNMFALDDLKLSTKMEIIPLIASEEDIISVINQTYTSAQTENIVYEVEKKLEEDIKKQEVEEIVSQDGEDAPMVQLVNNILERCILKGASDIHIEPFENYVRIRYRVDGMLHELTQTKKETLNSITTRIKILAGLDIAERRLPQDGRMSKKVAGQQVDLRVSILPTIYGEKTVIRFIYRTGQNLGLADIGFYLDDYEKVQNLLRNPHGVILVTGPTGSGKSTTLAAALKVLNRDHVNVITVEDPVENMIEGINQVAVNNKVGLTFASALRSILRQDPDVIMIGEMRDSETSSIAVRAAITGHLVLSTLHTNDAASSIPRLIDMGIEAYMVGAAVKGVISQRLVRRLCPACKKKRLISEAEANAYGIPVNSEVYEPRGCSICNYTGYKGRLAVHEVLVVDSKMEEMISAGNTSTEQIKAEAIRAGMRTLWDNACYNVLKGVTTVDEMLRIAYEQ